ncbi:MAG: 2'-5' RNA ligase [Methylotenera sp.]|nr:MAG: 2'-5' RNA ligase [Methylotenera sp.]
MDRYKYPRTPHLPWSPGRGHDDKILPNIQHFIGRDVVVTEKMDGENTTLYTDYSHARSIDGRYHPSRAWIKAFHATISHHIPDGWRICGENLYARHSISYDDLDSYFLAYSAWTDQNEAVDWDTTCSICETIGIPMVKVLYKGPFDEIILKNLANAMDLTKQEGYVVRIVDHFKYEEFGTSVAKFVRKGHVNSDEHWMHQMIIPNRLKHDCNN